MTRRGLFVRLLGGAAAAVLGLSVRSPYAQNVLFVDGRMFRVVSTPLGNRLVRTLGYCGAPQGPGSWSGAGGKG